MNDDIPKIKSGSLRPQSQTCAITEAFQFTTRKPNPNTYKRQLSLQNFNLMPTHNTSLQ